MTKQLSPLCAGTLPVPPPPPDLARKCFCHTVMTRHLRVNGSQRRWEGDGGGYHWVLSIVVRFQVGAEVRQLPAREPHARSVEFCVDSGRGATKAPQARGQTHLHSQTLFISAVYCYSCRYFDHNCRLVCNGISSKRPRSKTSATLGQKKNIKLKSLVFRHLFPSIGLHRENRMGK